MNRIQRTRVVVFAFSLMLLHANSVSAQTAQVTTRAKFEVGKTDLPTEVRSEIGTLCPILRNEKQIVVRGHRDHREYPSENEFRNFMLTVGRASVVVFALSENCNIPRERFFPQGSESMGDPSDTEGLESRTVTIRWGFRNDTDFSLKWDEYTSHLSSLLGEWKNQYREDHIEILALLYSIQENSSWGKAAYDLLLEQATNREEDRKRLESLLEARVPSWFLRVGGQVANQTNYGITVSLGTNPSGRLGVYVEGYGEWGTHDRYLYERPSVDEPTLHWGSWYAGHLILRWYTAPRIPGSTLVPYLEVGPGFVHVEYQGPTSSIGWHHTGFSTVGRVGLEFRHNHAGIEFYLGGDMMSFPSSRVAPEFATGEFDVDTQLGMKLTLYVF